MKKCMQSLLIIISMLTSYFAQEKSENTFGITISGFVKTDMMYDSRQTISIREGHFLLYPAAEYLDNNGNDINTKSSFNMLSIQTRLTGAITGPEFLGAKTSGLIEGAFFGHSDGDINGFRLRHAFVKLDWKNSSLLIGQYWHPMFITEIFPGVVSFNTGAPFQPFSRNPQIRFVQKFDQLQLSLVAATQRDFASAGPSGTSSVYLRNSVLPILDINLKFISEGFIAGAGLNYKSLTPRIVTEQNYVTDESVSGISLMGFTKISSDNLTLKLEGVLARNATDLTMIGGYATESSDPVTRIEYYTPIKTLSVWSELIYGKEIELGLFAGYTKNLGAEDNISGNYYSRGNNIASVKRISPRIIYSSGKTKFAGEIEYTSAEYGIPNLKGEVENPKAAENIRILLAMYLFF